MNKLATYDISQTNAKWKGHSERIRVHLRYEDMVFLTHDGNRARTQLRFNSYLSDWEKSKPSKSRPASSHHQDPGPPVAVESQEHRKPRSWVTWLSLDLKGRMSHGPSSSTIHIKSLSSSQSEYNGPRCQPLQTSKYKWRGNI